MTATAASSRACPCLGRYRSGGWRGRRPAFVTDQLSDMQRLERLEPPAVRPTDLFEQRVCLVHIPHMWIAQDLHRVLQLVADAFNQLAVLQPCIHLNAQHTIRSGDFYGE